MEDEALVGVDGHGHTHSEEAALDNAFHVILHLLPGETHHWVTNGTNLSPMAIL